MIVDCAHYQDGSRQHEGPLPVDEAAERRCADGFVWLGLQDPDEEELRCVAERFDLPELAVEDAMHTHQRLQANLAVISVHQNDVVKKISGWAAIITVPTLIASIYGMNFEHVPELGWRFGYPAALLVMVLVGFALHRVLRRADWL